MIPRIAARTQWIFRPRRYQLWLTLLLVCAVALPVLAQDDGILDDEEVEHGSDAAIAGQYVDLQPEFVLNYGSPDSRLRFLRLEVTLLMRDNEAAAQANHHSPTLRHIVVMNVTRAEREEVNTSAGRQALRQRLLREMQAAMDRETGETLVREVLFSNLIVQ